MSVKLDALVQAVKGVYDETHRLNNTFLAQFEATRAALLAIGTRLLADGGYANIDAAIADVSAQAGSTANAAIITATLTEGKALYALLNAYPTAGTLTQKLTSIGQVIAKINAMAKTIDRV